LFCNWASKGTLAAERARLMQAALVRVNFIAILLAGKPLRLRRQGRLLAGGKKVTERRG
jgi:hypothetical protein